MRDDIPQYEVAAEPCRKSGLNTLKLIKDGRSVYLHSKYDPVAEAEKLVKNLALGIDTVYLVFGLGMGHHIRALLSRMGNENKVLVLEPNSRVCNLFLADENNKDIINDERVSISKYISIYTTSSLLEPLYEDVTSYTKNFVFILPVYKDIYTAECRDFASSVKSKVLSCLLSKNTTEKFSDIWFRCLIDNMDFLRKSYSGKELANLYEGVPAIIVSAGPSLAKNIELLKEASKKAVVISVDTAYAPLYARGISPDWVVTIDAQPMVAKKFSGTDISEKDLITTYQSCTSVQKNHTGRIAAFSEFHVYLDKCYEDLGIDMLRLECGGSVACTALDLAYKMGANPIILVGQDFAHTGNVTHIQGTAFYKDDERAKSNTFEVDGVDGGKVLTTHNLNGYREWFEMFINVNGDRNYIDATEGGALIHGAEIMPLRKAIDDNCSENYDISERKERVFYPENRTATKEQFLSFVDDIQKSGNYLKRIVKEIDVCIGLTEKIIKEVASNGFSRPERIVTPYERIKKLNKSLEYNEHYVDLILPLVALERSEATRTDYLLNSSMTKEQVLALDLEKYVKYYKALSEKTKYAVPLTEAAVLREKENMEDGENER